MLDFLFEVNTGNICLLKYILINFFKKLKEVLYNYV